LMGGGAAVLAIGGGAIADAGYATSFIPRRKMFKACSLLVQSKISWAMVVSLSFAISPSEVLALSIMFVVL